jgi:chromosome segregation ATPase
MIDTNRLEELQQEIERSEHRLRQAERERDVLDISHKAIGHHLASTGRELSELRLAVRALLNDVRRRYPGEELQCQYLRRLDDLINSESKKPVIVTGDRRAA